MSIRKSKALRDVFPWGCCFCGIKFVELEDGKMKIVPVAGSRAFSRNSAKFFGHVVYSQVQLKAHKFTSTTTAMPHTIAGSRLDVATEKMDEPSLIPIFESGIKTNQSNGQIAAAQLKKLARK
jgi:hypothetical protein